MHRSAYLAVAAVLVMAGYGLVGAAAKDPQPGRYAMQPTDGGFLRLDTATGDVSLCTRAGASFECKPVKDDRDIQAEIARLAEENKALKAEIKKLDEQLGLEGGARPSRKLELPSEEDVDKAFSYLERMFKKFREKLKELDSGGSGKGTQL